MIAIDRNAFFRDVTMRISSSLDVGKALDRLFVYLRKILPIETMVLTYAGKDDGFYLVAISGLNVVGDIAPFRPLLFISSHEIDRISESMGAAFVQGPCTRLVLEGGTSQLHGIFKRFAVMPDFFSSMVDVILEISGEVIGELLVFSPKGVSLTPEHAALLAEVKDPIAIAMANARRYLELTHLKNRLADENRELQRDLMSVTGDQVVGAEFGLRRVMEMVRDVAPLNSPVLLLGETGTGKEVIANAIHHYSPRRDKPLVRVQCGAIPTTLLDSELFGHEKGSFTGAISPKRGRFERAEGGTIFLDEIGELTLDAQVKLLRVLQEKEIERLGGTETIQLDVRVVAATHRNLPKMVAEGSFREDLFFRLDVFPIFLPPLRERKEDVPVLALHFLNRKSREMGLASNPVLPEEGIRRLQGYDWPGNVRELQNVIERALITSRGHALVFPDLGHSVEIQRGGATEIRPAPEADLAPLEGVLANHIRKALALAHGKINGPDGAAARLGLHPNTLRYRMKKLGIAYGRGAQLP